MSKWVIGKYIRLSDADRDLMKKEGKTESESVSHQKALIQNFVNEKDELKDCEQYEFFDDGFSGTNFDRPSFEKLIEQIKKGKKYIHLMSMRILFENWLRTRYIPTRISLMTRIISIVL